MKVEMIWSDLFFGPFEPNYIIILSSGGVEILDATCKWNLFIPKKGMCKIWHFKYKMENFSLNDFTDPGRTVERFSSSYMKTVKIKKVKHQKKLI